MSKLNLNQVFRTATLLHYSNSPPPPFAANMTDEAKRRFSLFAKNFNKNSKKKQPADHEQQGLLDAEEEITFSPFANDSRSSDSGVELGSFVSSPNKRKDD